MCCGRGIFSVLSPDQTTTPGEISRAEEAELSLRGPLNESFPDGAYGARSFVHQRALPVSL